MVSSCEPGLRRLASPCRFRNSADGGHYEGSRPIVEIGWSPTPHLSLHLNYIFIFTGAFEVRSVHATPTDSYVAPWITYRF